jgi:plasmid maintenance system antidote protein VapI
MAKKLPPVHPGEVLREEFLVPPKLTLYAVATALNVPRIRIEARLHVHPERSAGLEETSQAAALYRP